MTNSEVKEWTKFFKDAGIPAAIGAKYALVFCDHRIQREMVGELTRDILHDIGIDAMGDKLAILKQAKTVSEQFERENTSKLLSSTGRNSPKPSSPAHRMINHSINSRDFTKGSPNRDAAKSTQEIGVFGRLGQTGPPEATTKVIFNRLGTQVKPTTELPYAGVLKRSASPLATKKVKISVKKTATTDEGTSILNRLGPVAVKAVTTTKPAAAAPKKIIKKKTIVIKKSAANDTKVSVMNRLGAKRMSPDSTARIGEKKVVNLKKTISGETGKKITITKIKPANPGKKLILKKTTPVKATPASPGHTVTLKRRSTDLNTEASPPKRQTVKLNKSSLTVKKTTKQWLETADASRKPISSNKVSSTSSAGIFKGGMVNVDMSVFSRLGKT